MILKPDVVYMYHIEDKTDYSKCSNPHLEPFNTDATELKVDREITVSEFVYEYVTAGDLCHSILPHPPSGSDEPDNYHYVFFFTEHSEERPLDVVQSAKVEVKTQTAKVDIQSTTAGE